MTYSEKLKDPRWQKRRLQILDRDQFECVECGDKDSQLHIHHKRYISRRNPWDYEDSDLTTLCETCHSKYTEVKADIDLELSKMELSDLKLLLTFLKVTRSAFDNIILWGWWIDGCFRRGLRMNKSKEIFVLEAQMRVADFQQSAYESGTDCKNEHSRNT